MLDDLKYIHQKDGSDALGIAAKQYKQLEHKFDVSLDSIQAESIENVIVAGMGGSALAAHMLTSWPGIKLPFEIVRNYSLPSYASSKTLFIASSYSGNTEETLSAINQAEEQNCQIVVITSGGKLAELATNKNYPMFKLPSDFQPRMAVFYNFAALIQLFSTLNNNDVLTKSLSGCSEWLKDEIKNWTAEVPTSRNPAKQLALELAGSTPVIYAGPKLFPAAYKWKISLNENAKNVAWCNQYPEFNHNEFIGWTSHPVEKPYKIVDLRCSWEDARIQKRFEVSERLLSGKRPAPEVVEVQGEIDVEQLLWAVAFGDFVSLYVALLNGIDPTPVDLIEKLKNELNN